MIFNIFTSCSSKLTFRALLFDYVGVTIVLGRLRRGSSPEIWTCSELNRLTHGHHLVLNLIG
jgi:hypothetical protein